MRTLIITLLVFSACANPDDIFPVTGRVESSSGIDGVTIHILRQTQMGAGFGNFCHFEGVSPFAETTTDAQGAYGFEVFRAQAQSLTNFTPYCFRVRAVFPSGAESHVDLEQINDRVQVPALRDWVPNPRLEGDELRFTPLLEDLGVDLRAERYVLHRSSFHIANDVTMWRADDVVIADAGTDGTDLQLARTPLSYPPEVFEDFAGTLRLEGRIVYTGNDDGGSLFTGSFAGSVYVTPAQSLDVGGNLVPLNRGLTRQPPVIGGIPGVTYTFPDEQRVSTLVLRDTTLTGGVFVGGLTADGGQVGPIELSARQSAWDLYSFPIFEMGEDGGFSQRQGTGGYGLWRFDGGMEVKTIQVVALSVPPEDGGVSLF